MQLMLFYSVPSPPCCPPVTSSFAQSSRIRLKVHDNKVSVDIDAGNKGWWQRCVTRAQIDMPAKWMYDSHIGVIAQTSEVGPNDIDWLPIFAEVLWLNGVTLVGAS